MQVPLHACWTLLAKHIRPQRAQFLLMAVLLLLSVALQLVSPQLIRAFIDAALAGAALRVLVLTGCWFVGIAVVQQGIAVAVVYTSENVAWRATNALRAELARHCLHMDMGFHNQHTPGELIERIDGDVTELADFFSRFFVLVAGNILMLAGVIAIMFVETWRAGLAYGLYAIVALWVLIRIRAIAQAHEEARRQAEADLYGFVEEQVAGTEDIRSCGAVDFSVRELYRHHAAILTHSRCAQARHWRVNYIIGAVLTMGTILTAVLGWYFFLQGVITLGTVYLFFRYMNLLESPILDLAYKVRAFQTIGACVHRLSALRATQAGVRDLPQGTVSVPARVFQARSPAHVVFDRVTFTYQRAATTGTNTKCDGLAAPALHDVSFELAPTRILGVLGRTGSGKSTLARLALRLYDPGAGGVRLDGHDLRRYRQQDVRRRVAMVTQEVQLFHGTLRDNVTFFDRTVDDRHILAALAALELEAWYAALPDGLATTIASGGRSISAGEAQLLALVRVFLRNPGLVIMDEASSRLDPGTERCLERAIALLLHARTAIIIAHRLATVQRADDILILEHGRVHEYGARAQLAATPTSRFSQLLQCGLEGVLT